MIDLNELIINEYYCCKDSNYYYYFKYTGRSNTNIFCSGGFIYKQNNKRIFEYTSTSNRFCDIEWLKFVLIEKCNFNIIVNYLPIDNIDRIVYYRKRKIYSLLVQL